MTALWPPGRADGLPVLSVSSPVSVTLLSRTAVEAPPICSVDAATAGGLNVWTVWVLGTAAPGSGPPRRAWPRRLTLKR